MSKRGSSGDDVSREETGWLDDLRKAKKSEDPLDRSDFTSGGTDRWAKLSALSDPDDSPPTDNRPSRSSGRRAGRAETPPAREPGSGRRRSADDAPSGRRAAPADPVRDTGAGRRARPEPEQRDTGSVRRGRPEPEQRDTGSIRRGRPEPEPEGPMGRRGRPEPEPEGPIGRRGRPEPDSEGFGGRRGRPEPDPESLVGRRARPEPEPDPASLIGRRARPSEPDPSTLIGRRARPDADTPKTPPPLDEPRRRSPFSDPISPAPPVSRPSRRDSGPIEDTPRRGSSPFGERSERSSSSFGEMDEREAPRRRSPFGNRAGSASAPSAPAPDEPPRRSRFGNRAGGAGSAGPLADEPVRRSPFSDRGAPLPPAAGAGAPSRPVGFKAPLVGAPEPIGPSRPLRGAALGLGGGLAGSVGGSGGFLAGPPPGGATTIRPNSPAAAPSSPPGVGPGGGLGGPGGPPGGPSPAGRRAGLAAGVQAIRGARSEVRRQLREQQRLRMWTLITLVVAVVGALPFYFVLRAATRDPVITSLDALAVPEWAVKSKNDNITGSRWCLLDCRYRERTAESAKPIPETAKAYREALLAAGWAPMINVPGCEPSELDDHSCWRRDEFTLDLTVSEPACAQDKLRRRPGFEVTATPSPGGPASPGSSGSPSGSEEECTGALVHIKVFNAIDDIRLRYSPEPTLDPELGKLTNEDLATPTPSPSP